MVSCGSYPALPWAAASPHEVQPPLEQPPVETAAPALTIGNGRLVLLAVSVRSEEHTSELQSRLHLVCRLLLEKKKKRLQYRRADLINRYSVLRDDHTAQHLRTR